MSLGLFNCRLIQPPEISYSSCRPSCRTGASSGELCSVILVTRHARPDQREGAECFLSFLLRVVLFGFLPSHAEDLFPPIHPRIPPKVSNPTHRFCYRAVFPSLWPTGPGGVSACASELTPSVV